MTPEQLQTLKAAIDADPLLSVQPMGPDGADFIAKELNKVASPDFFVWRSFVTQDEIMQNGFDWVRVDNLAVGKARIWEWMFANESRSINPSKANVRAGIEEVWKGTAADLAVRAAVLAHCKAKATRTQKLFASGTGSEADPAVMTVISIGLHDVEQARELA